MQAVWMSGLQGHLTCIRTAVHLVQPAPLSGLQGLLRCFGTVVLGFQSAVMSGRQKQLAVVGIGKRKVLVGTNFGNP